MTSMRIIAGTLLLLTPWALAQGDSETFPGVEKLMSEEEYDAAGLEKLTAQERGALNNWLIRYTAYEAPVIRHNNKEVQQVEKNLAITASINQPFSGWTGKSLFYLDNGEIWRQRTSGNYRYNGDDTRVVISKNFMGFYQMTLTATGSSIGVTRVK